MSNTPLPEPDYTQVTPPRFYKDERTIQHWWGAEAMHAHAAAVLAAERITAAHWQSLAEANMALAVSANKRMAAKDAEIAGLRADNTRLQNEVVMPLRERVRVLEDALTKIDAIRNDIIGRQKIGWSSHVYPLVAALDEAGYPGMEYEAARAALGDKICSG